MQKTNSFSTVRKIAMVSQGWRRGVAIALVALSLPPSRRCPCVRQVYTTFRRICINAGMAKLSVIRAKLMRKIWCATNFGEGGSRLKIRLRGEY